MHVFLESGDETEVIKKGRVQEIGEGADLARDLLGEVTSFFNGTGGRTVLGRNGLSSLGEAEIDGQNGLREAVVEFTAEAAAFFILKFKQVRSEAVDGALSILHLGDVGKRGNDAKEISVGVKLRSGVAEYPDDVLWIVWAGKAKDDVVKGLECAKDGR